MVGSGRALWLATIALFSLNSALAQKVAEYKLTVAGASFDLTSTYEEKDAGAFESLVKAKLPGQPESSGKLVGRWTGFDLTEAEMTLEGGGAKFKATYQNGAFTITGAPNAPKDPIKLDLKGALIWSQNFPAVSRSAFGVLEDIRSGKKVRLINLDTLTEQPIEAKATTRTVQMAGENRNFHVISFSLSGLPIQLFLDRSTRQSAGFHVPAQNASFLRVGSEAVVEDPIGKYPELPKADQPTLENPEVKVPMRDGVLLAGTLTRPKAEGKYPTILIRTPYDRKLGAFYGSLYAPRGYAVVVQDVRGRFGSGGIWDPLNSEVADGKDTLDWIVNQPWSNGSVGMIGASYLGYVQWAAAVTQHPALKCIIPQVSPPDPTRNIPWDNGAFLLMGAAWWSNIVKDNAPLSMAMLTPDKVDKLGLRPLTKVDDAVSGRNIPFFDKMLQRDSIDKWQGAFRHSQIASVKIPVLHVSGLWDGDGVGTQIHWEALRRAGGKQWLIFGPWEHGFNISTKQAGIDYGPDSLLELESVYLRFFETFLKNRDVKWNEQPKVRFFVGGANYWETGSDFPLPVAKPVTYFLGQGTLNARTSSGRDTLTFDPNSKIPPSKIFNPVATAPTRVRPEQLGDALLYRGPVLEQPKIYQGTLTAELYVSTTARDATLHVLVCEEKANGEIHVLGGPGTQRLTQFGPGRKLLQPGKVYKVQVRPWWFSQQLQVGSRLVIAVSSQLFPVYSQNPGTGESEATATRYIKATHTLHRSKEHPSRVTLWELP